MRDLHEDVEQIVPLFQGRCSLTENYLGAAEADALYNVLLQNARWNQPVITIFGKQVLSPRLAAWYGDADATYRYSGMQNHPFPWLPELSALRRRLLETHGFSFNGVLVNLYRDGNDAMGWHADNEPELGPNPSIASISLGATRTFLLKHRSDRALSTVKLPLNHGSLLLMTGETQHYWKHSVSRTRKVVGTRINLTFRQIVSGSK